MPFMNDKLRSIQMEDQEKQSGETGVGVSRQSGFPSRYTFEVEAVMSLFHEQIYGQERALQAIEAMLKVVKTEINDPEKPLYSGLFLGPTGVGKTEIVKVLAEAIHGSRNRFCRVDMNTMSLAHYAAALTGAPPGYVGSKEGASVLDKETIEGTYSRPGIVLFDEIEKANDQVIQTLLNIFDTGMMRLASGNDSINFKNTIVIMTSNLGAREIYRYADRRLFSFIQRIATYLQPKYWGRSHMEHLLDKLTKKQLERRFTPEYLNRMDDIIVFNWIQKKIMHRMINKYIEQLSVKLRKHNMTLQLQQSAISLLADKGQDTRYGGRKLKRIVRQYVEVPLADLLIGNPNKGAVKTCIGERTGKEDKITFRLESYE